MAYHQSNNIAKILRGEVPCIRWCETDPTLAFMDIMPQSRG
ncbi:HIT family protein, partial [Burkholderia pseudomallei]